MQKCRKHPSNVAARLLNKLFNPLDLGSEFRMRIVDLKRKFQSLRPSVRPIASGEIEPLRNAQKVAAHQHRQLAGQMEQRALEHGEQLIGELLGWLFSPLHELKQMP